MLRFLRKVILFSIELLALCALVGIFVYYHNYYLPNKNLFTNNKSKKILILGDSQTECAFKDSEWKTMINLSKSSDCYMFCYEKLKKFHANNPQLDTLILSYSSTSMQKDVDKRLHKEGIEKRLLLYGSLLKWQDYSEFSFNEIKENLTNLFFPNLSSGFIPERMGGYNLRPIEKIHLVRKKESTDNNYGNKCAQKYLKLIINYCSQNNIKLVLLATPIYLNDGFILDNYYKIHCKRYCIPFIDCSRLNYSDTLFYDRYHLNDNGAKKFTAYIKDINSNLK